MEILLQIVATCFFVLMGIVLVITIVDGIIYAIHPKSDRIFSIFIYCIAEQSYFRLYYKTKKIDYIFVYGKYNRHYYFVGLDGIYRLKKPLCKLQKIQDGDLQKDEKAFISNMIKDRIAKVTENKDLLESFISKYDK
ncbi:MAG: hypothetical protein ACI4HZ_03600 [Ruminococcus sp.]